MRAHLAALAVIAVVVAGSCHSAGAHEFWLEPTQFTPGIGESVPITIFIGQNFKGDSFPYVGAEIKRFVMTDARGEKPVKGVDGDDPAVTIKPSVFGLVSLSHYSTRETVVFDDFPEFEKYLRMEGLNHIGPRHREQNKPMVKIREFYSRCAKLLLGVGDAAGEDRWTGMPLELVAERNPYKLAPGEELPVRLLHNGKPIAGIQITAFSRADPETKVKVRTDAQGRARIVLAQSGPWLLNAVHMIEPSPRDNAHWASLWASMTFSRP
jgi:uncharacterized GH25 family protein